MALEQTWRWFGPDDPVRLEEIKQTGAKGIVTALHQVPTGDIWNIENILERKKLIEEAGFAWSVVESLPVHECIKKREGNYRQFIENYKTSIKNIGQCGIDTICYNFMPILDWSRTDLSVEIKDGMITTKFETTVFAAFDLFILQRPDAKDSYSNEQIEKSRKYYESLTEKQRDRLIEVILLGFPGSLESYTFDEFRNAVIHYQSVKKNCVKIYTSL
jgi:mannonate dehydratase